MKKLFLTLAVAVVTLSASAQKPVELFSKKTQDSWSVFSKNMEDIPSQIPSFKGKSTTLSGKLGFIYSNEVYSNYKLSMEWRWVEGAGNSGLFIHSQGEMKMLPTGYEMQLMSGDAGCIYHLGGTSSAELKKQVKRGPCKKLREDSENSVGEWNKMEVTASGDSIVVFVNGLKVNEITGLSHTSGHIGVQSEGTPIELRNVVLTPLE